MNKRKKQGITLIELIVAITLVAIIAAVISFVVNSGLMSWLFMREQKEIMAQTRSALQRMVREIRRTNSTDGIIIFNATEYEFRDIAGQQIEYAKDGADLERNNEVILENLDSSGLSFVYLNKYGSVEANKDDIRTIQITLIVQKGDNRVRLRSAASIRNR